MELVRIKWKWEFCTTLRILRFHVLMKLKINALRFDCGGALDIGWWFLLFNSVMRRKCHSLIGIEKLLYFILLCLTLVFVLKTFVLVFYHWWVCCNKKTHSFPLYLFYFSNFGFSLYFESQKLFTSCACILILSLGHIRLLLLVVYSVYFYAILMNLLRNDKIGRHNKIWFASCIISPALLATLQISGINILLLSTEN